MNGSVTQFTNLMRFPQLGPVSHKFTMRGGHSFVSIKPHSEHFPRGERCRGHVREPRGEEELEADHWQETTVAFWDPLALHWITGSAASPPESLFPSCSCKRSCQMCPGHKARGTNSEKKPKLHYEIHFSHENRIPERILTHNQGWRQLFLLVCVLICSKWQLYSTTCLASSSCFIILYHNCLLLINSIMIATEFIHLWKTDASCHSLVMEEENKKGFLQLSEESLNYLQSKFYSSELQLNATPHRPYTFLPLGNKKRVGFAEFHHPGLTHSRLSPWPSGCQVHLSSPAQRRGLAHDVITHGYFHSTYECLKRPPARGQRRQEHGAHSHQRPLEDSSPRFWPTDLKAK